VTAAHLPLAVQRAMSGLPPAVVLGQVAPGRARAQDPEDRVDAGPNSLEAGDLFGLVRSDARRGPTPRRSARVVGACLPPFPPASRDAPTPPDQRRAVPAGARATGAVARPARKGAPRAQRRGVPGCRACDGRRGEAGKEGSSARGPSIVRPRLSCVRRAPRRVAARKGAPRAGQRRATRLSRVRRAPWRGGHGGQLRARGSVVATRLSRVRRAPRGAAADRGLMDPWPHLPPRRRDAARRGGWARRCGTGARGNRLRGPGARAGSARGRGARRQTDRGARGGGGDVRAARSHAWRAWRAGGRGGAREARRAPSGPGRRPERTARALAAGGGRLQRPRRARDAGPRGQGTDPVARRAPSRAGGRHRAARPGCPRAGGGSRDRCRMTRLRGGRGPPRRGAVARATARRRGVGGSGGSPPSLPASPGSRRACDSGSSGRGRLRRQPTFLARLAGEPSRVRQRVVGAWAAPAAAHPPCPPRRGAVARATAGRRGVGGSGGSPPSLPASPGSCRACDSGSSGRGSLRRQPWRCSAPFADRPSLSPGLLGQTPRCQPCARSETVFLMRLWVEKSYGRQRERLRVRSSCEILRGMDQSSSRSAGAARTTA
jgi:hypothetical protein